MTDIGYHRHFDHCGDISSLNPSTDLVVGPGFKERFYPGYPAKEDSALHEADFKGRNVVELSFSDSFKIGGYQAHDYFDDGSLYILNVPGHTTGHISAIVRTTPDTFAFLGGDVCHFTGVIRPSSYIPMPETIPAITELNKRFPHPAPCSVFTACHPNQKNAQTVSKIPGYRDNLSFEANISLVRILPVLIR
jgi:glyoxylase-like metal-dependent hydrolase (beta-lactamase superfamily II)